MIFKCPKHESLDYDWEIKFEVCQYAFVVYLKRSDRWALYEDVGVTFRDVQTLEEILNRGYLKEYPYLLNFVYTSFEKYLTLKNFK